MRFLHQYNTFLLLIILTSVISCSSYETVVIHDRIALPGGDRDYTFADKSGKKKSAFKTGKQKSVVITSKKYLVKGKGFTPESMIMNEGIKEALSDNYIEAEILFKQIKLNSSDGSVENNLAVIYELTKRKKDAMLMYTKALLKSPDNREYRSNMQSFINHNKF